jgi:hypothetical protein
MFRIIAPVLLIAHSTPVTIFIAAIRLEAYCRRADVVAKSA